MSVKPAYHGTQVQYIVSCTCTAKHGI